MNVYEQTRGCKNSPIFNKDINRTILCQHPCNQEDTHRTGINNNAV